MPGTTEGNRRKALTLVAWGVSFLLAGCGSGGGASGGPADAGGSPGSGALSWTDDGVKHTTAFATAAFVGSALMDTLQIAGGESSGIGIAMGVSATPPLVPGTYVCAQNGMRPIVSFVYDNPGVGPVTTACTIVITTIGIAAGTHATGTFSATVPLTAGGAKAITNGSFDLVATSSRLP